MQEVIRINGNAIIRKSEEQERGQSKRPRQDCVPLDRLVVWARGFGEICNHSFPLDDLHRLIDRHQFSTSVSGLSFPSDLIREKAMRGVWKPSFNETIPELQEQFAGMEIDE